MMPKCPICKRPCEQEIFPNFVFCMDCSIALREKETIAKNREEIYSTNWVEAHSESPEVDSKADFILSVVKKLLSAGRILDVGCASGVLVNKLVKAGYSVKGLDLSEAAISFASQNMLGEFVVGDAKLEVVTGEELYDVIVASHLVEHLENPQDLFAGVRRLLKPRGYFCVAIPNLKWYKPQSIWRSISSLFDQDHVACYTYSSLAKVLVKAGFRITLIRTRTLKTDFLTVICVGVYNSMFRKNKEVVSLGKNISTSHGVIQRIYKAVVALPIFPLVMYIPNRISERNYSGMELVIVAEKPFVANAARSRREKFTYDYYKEFLHRLCEVYTFTTFQEGKRIIGEVGKPLAIMRHDIDVDLETARKISSLEKDLGLRSTYFFMVRCPLYNVFSSRSSEQVKEILTSGHHLGLHFDCALYEGVSVKNIDSYISKECQLLEGFFGHPVEAISFHRPSVLELSGVELEKWPQTYEKVFLERFKYFSDSRGNWAYGNPIESAAFSRKENLHILVHPEWWTELPTTPYQCLVSLLQQIGHRSEQYISENCQVWNGGKTI